MAVAPGIVERRVSPAVDRLFVNLLRQQVANRGNMSFDCGQV